MSDVGRWHRDLFAEAVFASDLRPIDRLVALVFADHGGAEDCDVWVSYERLMARSGLARSTAAAAVTRLVEGGWLRPTRPARQHYSPRYRLQMSDSRTPQMSGTRTPDTPDVRLPSPDVRLPSPDVRDTDPTSLPYLPSTQQPAAEVPVIVEPQDRQPGSEDALTDECRALGAPWDLGDVISARRVLRTAWGGDARAAGAADAAIRALAKRKPPIRSLGGFLRKLEQQGDLDTIRVTVRAPKAVIVLGCPDCADSLAGRGFVGDPDHPAPCACRRRQAIAS